MDLWMRGEMISAISSDGSAVRSIRWRRARRRVRATIRRLLWAMSAKKIKFCEDWEMIALCVFWLEDKDGRRQEWTHSRAVLLSLSLAFHGRCTQLDSIYYYFIPYSQVYHSL